jgi:hypothetical protein
MGRGSAQLLLHALLQMLAGSQDCCCPPDQHQQLQTHAPQQQHLLLLLLSLLRRHHLAAMLVLLMCWPRPQMRPHAHLPAVPSAHTAGLHNTHGWTPAQTQPTELSNSRFDRLEQNLAKYSPHSWAS